METCPNDNIDLSLPASSTRLIDEGPSLPGAQSDCLPQPNKRSSTFSPWNSQKCPDPGLEAREDKALSRPRTLQYNVSKAFSEAIPSSSAIENLLSSYTDQCARLFSSVSPAQSKSISMCTSSLLSACNVYKELEKAKKDLINATIAVQKLQLSLGVASCVRFVVEMESVDERAGSSTDPILRRHTSVFPFFSNTLMHALVHANEKAAGQTKFSEQFLDLFARAHILTSSIAQEPMKERDMSPSPDAVLERHGNLQNDPLSRSCGAPAITIPDWFSTDRFYPDDKMANCRQTLLCDYGIITKLGELPAGKLETVSGNFFSYLHKRALNKSFGFDDFGNPFEYRGPLVYQAWTPPWLRATTEFVGGKRNNASIIFVLGYLPNKAWCRKKENKSVCRAILEQWLRRELSTRSALLAELKRSGIHILAESIPLPTPVSVVPSNPLALQAPRQDQCNGNLPCRPSADSATEPAPVPSILKSRIPTTCDASATHNAALEKCSIGVQSTVIPEQNPDAELPAHAMMNNNAQDEEAAPLKKARLGSRKHNCLTDSSSVVLFSSTDATPQREKSDEAVARIRDFEITRSDLRTLLPAKWLNSHVINFFFQLLQRNADSVMVLNTWFYTRIDSNEENFAHMARWVKASDLEKENLCFILIPVHCDRLKHWGLISIEKENSTVRLYDSLPDSSAFGSAAKTLASWCGFLKSYLQLKNWAEKWTSDANCATVMQTNLTDCGVFVCINAYNIVNRLSTATYTPAHAARFRNEIKASILSQNEYGDYRLLVTNTI